MFARDPQTQLRRALEEFRPDVAGFTIRNLDNQDMGNPVSLLPQIREFVALAKQAGVPTVLGGTAFTTFPAAMLEFMDADYGIAGQGEVGMPRLVEGIGGGSVDREIPGLVWRVGDDIRSNPPSKTGYRNVSGDWGVLDIKGYRRSIAPATVLIKTGCPYECSYCDAYSTFGKRFHVRDPGEIVEDIRAMRGEYDDEFLALYRRAGGRCAMLGVESFSDTMLRSYQKPFELHDVLEFSTMIRRHGIKFGVEG